MVIRQTLLTHRPTPNDALSTAGISDDQAGGPIMENTPVTYTVTFSEDINQATVGDDGYNATLADDAATRTAAR